MRVVNSLHSPSLRYTSAPSTAAPAYIILNHMVTDSICCRHRVLQISSGIDEPGGFVWELTLTLFIIWVMVYFCVWRGVSWGGKVCTRMS